MAITINGTGSITGLTAGGLPDGSVTAADIETSLDLTGKTVTLPSGTGGKILQVKNCIKTDREDFTGTTAYQDITGLSLTITPASNNSKLVFFFNINYGGSGYNTLQFLRGTTQLFKGTATGGNGYSQGIYGTANDQQYNIVNFGGCHVDDSHNSGGTPLTYKMQVGSPWASGYITRINVADYITAIDRWMSAVSSSIVVMEVAE